MPASVREERPLALAARRRSAGASSENVAAEPALQAEAVRERREDETRRATDRDLLLPGQRCTLDHHRAVEEERGVARRTSSLPSMSRAISSFATDVPMSWPTIRALRRCPSCAEQPPRPRRLGGAGRSPRAGFSERPKPRKSRAIHARSTQLGDELSPIEGRGREAVEEAGVALPPSRRGPRRPLARRRPRSILASRQRATGSGRLTPRLASAPARLAAL